MVDKDVDEKNEGCLQKEEEKECRPGSGVLTRRVEGISHVLWRWESRDSKYVGIRGTNRRRAIKDLAEESVQ